MNTRTGNTAKTKSAMNDIVPPFGTYSLSNWRESLRKRASNAPNSRLGMWRISILRKLSLLGHSVGMKGPIDVPVAKDVNARVFPGSNRCEKRAYAGVQIWDSRERLCLDQHIAQADGNREYVFLDVGANVGFYSLFVNASAKQHVKSLRIIAVEPDSINRSRLNFNLAASNCVAEVEPIGIAEKAGTGVLTDPGENRGTIAVAESGSGEQIQLETLAELFVRKGVTHVDAMKIDIEGRDKAALKALVEQAPKSVWPRLLIVEVGHRANSPIVTQMLGYGYTLKERAGINAVLEFNADDEPRKAGV